MGISGSSAVQCYRDIRAGREVRRRRVSVASYSLACSQASVASRVASAKGSEMQCMDVHGRHKGTHVSIDPHMRAHRLHRPYPFPWRFGCRFPLHKRTSQQDCLLFSTKRVLPQHY
jgi:hypothetical protein